VVLHLGQQLSLALTGAHAWRVLMQV
jgi:hypothetical protein